jgi:hypothetical protein
VFDDDNGIPNLILLSVWRERAEWLAKRVCAISADLDASRLDPRAGTVIPEPKSYRKGTGVFAVPTALDIVCSTEHEAALELLAGDLARHGVKAARAESSAKAAFVMGVPSSDPAAEAACKRLGITVNEGTPGPEGYVLVVTPEEVLIADLARLILKQAGLGTAIAPQPAAHDPIKRRCPDISLAEAKLDWRPKVGLDEGLAATVDDFKKRLGA